MKSLEVSVRGALRQKDGYRSMRRDDHNPMMLLMKTQQQLATLRISWFPEGLEQAKSCLIQTAAEAEEGNVQDGGYEARRNEIMKTLGAQTGKRKGAPLQKEKGRR